MLVLYTTLRTVLVVNSPEEKNQPEESKLKIKLRESDCAAVLLVGLIVFLAIGTKYCHTVCMPFSC